MGAETANISKSNGQQEKQKEKGHQSSLPTDQFSKQKRWSLKGLETNTGKVTQLELSLQHLNRCSKNNDEFKQEL